MNIDHKPAASCSEGIVLVSNFGIIEWLNSQAENLLSTSKKQAIGQPIIEIISSQVPEFILKDLSEKFHCKPIENNYIRSLDSKNQLLAHCDALLDSTGHTAWIITLSKAYSPPSPLESPRTLICRYKKTIITAGVIILIAIAIYPLQFSTNIKKESLAIESNTLNSTILNGTVNNLKSSASSLSVVGTIEAGDSMIFTAPFDAVVTGKEFSFDTEVSKNQLLLRLDTTELLEQVQEAKIAMLKAKNTLQELDNWEESTEVARAKRTAAMAQRQVEETKRKIQEAEILLQKGIIPRSEYDGLIEQLNGSKSQLAAALDEVKTVYEKASKGNLEIARIEYEQAKAKYKNLSSSLSIEKIYAPREGIIAKAPATSGQAQATLEPGSRVTRGQLLFNIASTARLMVSAKVDESDIVDLSPGMKAEISLDSQDMPPIYGRLVDISAQAAQNSGNSRSAIFDIKIEIPKLNEKQRHHLRIGMSCNVSINKIRTDVTTIPPTKSKFSTCLEGMRC